MKSHLVIHHSLTADSKTVSWAAIRHYHTTEMGFRDIGYHFGVELIGEHYEMLVGRPMLERAAAAYQQGMNRKAIHVCFVGNFDREPPDLGMLRFALPHLTDICEALNIPIDGDHIIGHRKVATYKSCPGKLFNVETLVRSMQTS